MKAVTQRTGIPAPTLRAWERRYKALAPSRSSGNYRLYSERDLALLMWLHRQIEAGLSISRAVVLLERLIAADAAEPAARPVMLDKEQLENLPALSAALHGALTATDERAAGAVLAEAFALYALEDVCEGIIAPALVRIGEDWHAGLIGIAVEHFGTAYLLGRLLSLFNAQPVGDGRLVLVGCAPGERHEIGALMLALMLRRGGANVRYLGADVPVDAWARAIRELSPRVVAISAMTPEAAERLDALSGQAGMAHLVLGGAAYGQTGAQLPVAPAELGPPSLRASVARIHELLSA